MGKKLYKHRREFLELAGVGLLSALVIHKAEGAEIRGVQFKALDKNTQIDVGHRGKEVIEKAYKLGHEYEKKHGGMLQVYSCCSPGCY